MTSVHSRRHLRCRRPEFSVAKILAWADAYHQRTGTWPTTYSGPLLHAPGDSWRRVDNALRYGLRGLPGRSSLARVLAEHRQVRNVGQLPPLRPKQILAWADAHQRRTQAWPTSDSGPITEAPGETWRAVDGALRLGIRGLPGSSSLAQFLLRHRGVRHIGRLPRLGIRQILDWADAHYYRTGQWPNRRSGPIADAPGETWNGINAALAKGQRGLPGKASLPRLLAQHRGVRNSRQLPRLTLRRVRAWAQAHRRRTGQWPTAESGRIRGAPGETWSAVKSALYWGHRGLPGGLALACTFALPSVRSRKKANQAALSVAQILGWADANYRRTGAWPHARSGRIADATEETWRGVDQALRTNQRGLQYGGTLARLLAEQRGQHSRSYRPRLTDRQILAWARHHFRYQGAWPNFRSGPIADALGETWRGVDEALRFGLRGLSGRRSLAQLLAEHLGIRNRTTFPPLNQKQILIWAKEYHRRNGTWPTANSGVVSQAPAETWKGVDQALRVGYRGLRGGLTLARLLARRCGIRNRSNLPRLSPLQIVRWAEAHFQRTGTWPTRSSGPIFSASEETWNGVEMALAYGFRGLPGKSSLSRLLLRQ